MSEFNRGKFRQPSDDDDDSDTSIDETSTSQIDVRRLERRRTSSLQRQTDEYKFPIHSPVIQIPHVYASASSQSVNPVTISSGKYISDGSLSGSRATRNPISSVPQISYLASPSTPKYLPTTTSAPGRTSDLNLQVLKTQFAVMKAATATTSTSIVSELPKTADELSQKRLPLSSEVPAMKKSKVHSSYHKMDGVSASGSNQITIVDTHTTTEEVVDLSTRYSTPVTEIDIDVDTIDCGSAEISKTESYSRANDVGADTYTCNASQVDDTIKSMEQQIETGVVTKPDQEMNAESEFQQQKVNFEDIATIAKRQSPPKSSDIGPENILSDNKEQLENKQLTIDSEHSVQRTTQSATESQGQFLQEAKATTSIISDKMEAGGSVATTLDKQRCSPAVIDLTNSPELSANNLSQILNSSINTDGTSSKIEDIPHTQAHGSPVGDIFPSILTLMPEDLQSQQHTADNDNCSSEPPYIGQLIIDTVTELSSENQVEVESTPDPQISADENSPEIVDLVDVTTWAEDNDISEGWGLEEADLTMMSGYRMLFDDESSREETEVEPQIPTTIEENEEEPIKHMQLGKGSWWQYKQYPKGPKGNEFDIVLSPTDPHQPVEFTDPVFKSEKQEVSPQVHAVGKPRLGDGNDITPNAKLLTRLGDLLKKINTEMDSLGESSSRKDKMKLASKLSRVKRRANHEANKIIFEGVERERDALSKAVKKLKSKMSSPISSVSLEDCYREVVATLPDAVAGKQHEYVTHVLRSSKSDLEASS